MLDCSRGLFEKWLEMHELDNKHYTFSTMVSTYNVTSNQSNLVPNKVYYTYLQEQKPVTCNHYNTTKM